LRQQVTTLSNQVKDANGQIDNLRARNGAFSGCSTCTNNRRPQYRPGDYTALAAAAPVLAIVTIRAALGTGVSLAAHLPGYRDQMP
jgi:hypothetical protein